MVLFLLIDCLLLLPLCGFCVGFLFCNAILCVLSSFYNHIDREEKALLKLSSYSLSILAHISYRQIKTHVQTARNTW